MPGNHLETLYLDWKKDSDIWEGLVLPLLDGIVSRQTRESIEIKLGLTSI